MVEEKNKEVHRQTDARRERWLCKSCVISIGFIPQKLKVSVELVFNGASSTLVQVELEVVY